MGNIAISNETLLISKAILYFFECLLKLFDKKDSAKLFYNISQYFYS